MAEFVTFAQATAMLGEEHDTAVAEQFPKSNYLLANLLVHPVAVQAGTAAHVFKYLRESAETGAGFRALNDEYTASTSEVEEKEAVCAILGGSFKVDRTVEGAGNIVTRQVKTKVRATNAAFNAAFINGDHGTNPEEFDGLMAAITSGQTAELDADWSAITSGDAARVAAGEFNKATDLVDGTDGVIMVTGRDGKAAIETLGLQGGWQTASESAAGQRITSWNGIPVVDLGAGVGSAAPIIGVDEDGFTDIWVVRLAEDGVHLVSPANLPAVKVYLPADAGTAVRQGSVELVTAPVVRTTRSIARIKVKVAAATP